MNTALNQITTHINNLPKPALIGVSGFGGSGKSTFAAALGQMLDAPVVGVDSFATSNIHKNYELWELMDYKRIEREIIQPFLAGSKNIRYGNFDWIANKLGDEVTVKHSGIIIVEGVALFRPEIQKSFSCTIWIDCPIEEAMRRGKKRDREEYNNPQDEYWDGIWKQNDLACFEAFAPKENADFIVDHSKIGIYNLVA